MPLGHELQIQQPRVTCRGVDRAVKVELVCGALARKSPQFAKRNLDVAGAEFHRIVEISEIPLFPDLDGSAVAARPPHSNAFRIESAVAERRRAARADPLVSALMPFLLLLEPLLEGLHQFFPVPERLDLLFFFLGEHALHRLAQPVLGDLGAKRL